MKCDTSFSSINWQHRHCTRAAYTLTCSGAPSHSSVEVLLSLHFDWFGSVREVDRFDEKWSAKKRHRSYGQKESLWVVVCEHSKDTSWWKRGSLSTPRCALMMQRMKSKRKFISEILRWNGQFMAENILEEEWNSCQGTAIAESKSVEARRLERKTLEIWPARWYLVEGVKNSLKLITEEHALVDAIRKADRAGTSVDLEVELVKSFSGFRKPHRQRKRFLKHRRPHVKEKSFKPERIINSSTKKGRR